MAVRIVSKKLNLAVLLALACATWGIAYVDLGRWNLVVALGIAVLKAALVVAVFMHGWFAPRVMKIAFAAGFFWLGIMVVLTMSDYLSRNWMSYPRGDYSFLGSAGEGSR